MPFNKDISGFDNEKEFVKAINRKKFCELNPILQDVVKYLYPSIKAHEYIYCFLNKYKLKYDIALYYNHEYKYISIKKGIKNSVHTEKLSTFIEFLKSIGVNKYIINYLLLYHYGDGTLDGSGYERYTVDTLHDELADSISIMNFYFSNPYIIEKIIDRCIFKGVNSKNSIDLLIYGIVEDFIWITPQEINDIVLKYRWVNKKGVGFGPLFYQPLNRCINGNKKYERSRYFVQIKWYHLSDHIIEVMCNRNGS